MLRMLFDAGRSGALGGGCGSTLLLCPGTSAMFLSPFASSLFCPSVKRRFNLF